MRFYGIVIHDATNCADKRIMAVAPIRQKCSIRPKHRYAISFPATVVPDACTTGGGRSACPGLASVSAKRFAGGVPHAG